METFNFVYNIQASSPSFRFNFLHGTSVTKLRSFATLQSLCEKDFREKAWACLTPGRGARENRSSRAHPSSLCQPLCLAKRHAILGSINLARYSFLIYTGCPVLICKCNYLHLKKYSLFCFVEPK